MWVYELMSSTPEKAPLEDIMAAMDVVDTLRHEQSIVERELDSEARRARLLERLRELYRAQGIKVSDQVLSDGIEALEQERFKYRPIKPNWRTVLGRIWVSRERWSKPFGFMLFVALIFYGFYFVSEVLPERQLRANLPGEVNSIFSTIVGIAKDSESVDQAKSRSQRAYLAIEQGDLDTAKNMVEDMRDIERQLSLEYEIRIISRPNQNSGIWRVPPGNPNGKNYYLIVEAIDKSQRPLELNILNQENNTFEKRTTWGLRVNEETFFRVAADKQDDGIIQSNIVGEKTLGYLKPVYRISTSGATITRW